MYSRVVKVTKEIVKKGISVGICLAMLLPILPLNFSFIMNTEKEARAETDYCTSKANANSWAHSDLRAWLNNGLATSVPDDGSAAPTGKNFKLDSTATSDNTSGYAKSAFSDDEWSKLKPITYYSDDGNGSYHKLTDKVVIPCSGGSNSNMILKTQPEGVDVDGTYSVPWKDLSYSNNITCTPTSDPTKIRGFSGFGERLEITVSDNGYVNPIIKLSEMSQIVCAPTLTELNNDGGIITRTLTKDSASSSARMCFWGDLNSLEVFYDSRVDENGQVGFKTGRSDLTCVAMAMKKNSDGSIETITSYSNSYNEGWVCIDFGKTKEELKDYAFYVWQENGSEKYAVAGCITGFYWSGDSLTMDMLKASSPAFDGFKGIIYGNDCVDYQGTVPFGNRTWQHIDENYFLQTQLESAIFNSSTAGYGATQTGITLSDELSNGIELTTTGSAVTIPTDGITLTGFPASTPISFHYRTQGGRGAWTDGTPQNAGTYYVMASADGIDYERKYSRAFPLTVKEIPVPKYTAPTTKIDAEWRDVATDKLPQNLADYFGYPKTASGANIPGTWSIDYSDVGNVDGSNGPCGMFTPDPTVLDTYNWAGLSWWDGKYGMLRVPALFAVAPLPAKDIAYGVSLGISDENIKTTYDGTDKTFGLITFWPKDTENKWNAGIDTYMIGTENFDIDWPEDMINAGTKIFTVDFKNNCTGTLTGTVEIEKRQIEITADNKTINYGEQLPQLTWQQSGDGFVLSDSLIEGTVAVEESGDYPGPGEYNIVPSGFSTSEPNNYEVSHVNGKLTINGPSAGNVTMSLNQNSFPFNGRRQNLIVTVKDGNDILKENVHYALNIIGDLVNVGQGRAEATLQAPYETRTLTKDWSITKRDVNVKIDDKCKVKGEDDPTFTYTVTAVDNGETIDGVDLTLTRDSGEDLGGSYTIRLASTSNSNANIVNVTTGTLKIGTDIFEITPRDISNATVTVTPTSKEYTGGGHTPNVVLTDILNSVTKTLTLNTDYTLTWPSDMTNVGPKQGVITGQGNYTGTTNANYEITGVPTDNIRVTFGLSSNKFGVFKYSGISIQPAVEVFDGETKLQSSNYSIAWPEDTILPGTKTVTITLLDKYGGKQVTGTYRIGIDSEYGDKLLDILPQDSPFWPTYENGNRIPGEWKVVNGCQYSTENPLVGDVTWLSNDTADKDTILRHFNVGFWPEDENGRNYLASINNINTDGSGNIVYRPIEVPVLVMQKTLTDDMVTMTESGAYTGSEITPAITIKNGDTTLALGTDYTVSYEGDRVNVGSFKVIITGQGNYKGSVEKTYTITKKNVTSDSNVTVRVTSPTLPYTGQPPEVTVEVKDGDEILVRGTDYTVDADGIEPGEHTVTITFIKNRTGTKEGTYTIEAKPTDGLRVELDKTKFTYNGWFRRPEVTVYDDNDIVSSDEYTLDFSNDVNVGTATAKATMSAKYGNKVLQKTYTIEKREPIVATYGDFVGNVLPINQLKTFIGPITYVHSGWPVGNEVSGGWLWKINDAEVSNGINFSVGDATTGDETRTFYALYFAGEIGPNSYMSSVKDLGPIIQVFQSTNCIVVPIEFKVQPQALADDMLTMTESGAYTGSEITPDVTVKDGDTTLVLDTDYTVSYEGDRVNVGSFKVTVTGKGNYQGSVEKTYTITAPTSGNVGVTLSNNSFTYNGSKQTPTVMKVTFNGAEVPSSEYTASIPTTSTNADTYTVTVTLSANYGSQTGTATYTINRKPVTVTAANKNQVYGEAAQTLTYTTNTGDTLNGDLTRASGNNVGTYDINQGTVTNANNSNYDITYVKGTYMITAAPITDSAVTLSSSSFTYDGSEQKPTVTVTVGERTLTVDTDYTIIWPTNPVDVSSSYSITVTGKGNYSGTVTKTYAITRKAVSDSTTDSKLGVTTGSTTFTYNGSPQELGVQITYNGETLQEGVDYTKSYTDASGGNDITNQGTKTLRVTFIKNLDGTITRTYTINPLSITDSKVSFALDPASAVFTGSALTTEAKGTVTFSGTRKDLVKGTDFEFNCPANLINKGDYTLTITGKGNYSGTLNKTFSITAASSDDGNISADLDNAEVTYNGGDQKVGVTVKEKVGSGTRTLQENVDYTKSYTDASGGNDLTNVGTKTVTISLKGNYSGTITKTYRITQRDITSDNDFVVTLSPESSVYTGVAHTPTLTAKYKNVPLTEGSSRDYTKSVTGNMTDQGNHTYTVTGQGNFKGSKTVKYTITQRSVSDSTPESELDIKLSETEPVYSKEEKRPTVTAQAILSGQTIPLTLGTDFTVSYKDINDGSDLTNVGQKKAIITFINNLSGTVTKEYTIVARDITSDNDFVVTVSPTSSVYTRSKHTPTITVKYKNAPVATDDWSHSSSEDMISAKVNILTILGQGNFKGSKTVNYTITPKSITVTAVNKTKTYGDADPELTIDAPELVAGDTLSGSLERAQGENANTYEIRQKTAFVNPNYTITFKPGTFTIKPRVVSDGEPNGVTMTLNPETMEFNGERQLPEETLNDTNTGEKLIKGQDYDLEYVTNMTDAIVHTIKANLKGNYSGSKTATFTITPKQISDNTPESELKVDVDKTGYTDETGYTYDKTPKRPAVTIKAMFGNRTMPLVQGTHFEVNYLAENGTSDVTNVGPKKMVITFKNGFSGTKTIKYAINRRDVTIRANERKRYYKAPDPDMRPRIDYDIINGLIAGDNLYGSFEREDPTNEEVGRYKLIQGTTLTNANNPNYNIIFDAENSGYFIIEVDKSSWGTPQDDPKDHYVDDEGTTSVEIKDRGITWLKEEFKEGSIDKSVWFGLDNSLGIFRIGSRFSVALHNDMEDVDDIDKIEEDNYHRFDVHITDPDGGRYEDLSKYFENLDIPEEGVSKEAMQAAEDKAVVLYVQYEGDWDPEDLAGACIVEGEDEDITTFDVGQKECPEGLIQCAAQFHHHFSPFIMYDEFTDAERKALEGNDDETNVLRTTVDIKGKTVQIIVSGPRRVLQEGTRLIAVVDSRDNTCKIWLIDEGGNELPRPLSERVEVFIEMVDGMEDLIEVRLPKIGEDFHYGKFDGSWYGAIYTPYFPISLSLDELTDAEKDELNKKRGINGESVEGSGSEGASGDSRNNSNVENDGQGDNETGEIQQAENGSSNWWQNLSQYQIICITAAGILLLLLLIFLILLILKRRKEKENSSQQ